MVLALAPHASLKFEASAEERKPGRIMNKTESFQTQQSSHQIRLLQDLKYISKY